jgi:hypothetical protein
MKQNSGYAYFIRSAWKERIETPAAIGVKFVNTLDALNDIDPIFAGWEVFDHRNRSSLSLSAARQRIAQLFERNVARSDFGNLSPDYGYSASAMAGEFKHPRSVTFRVNAGGRWDNRMELQFGEYDVLPDLSVITYPLFRKALLAINAIWCMPWLCAQTFRSGTVAVPMDFGGVQGSRIEGVVQVPSDPTFPRSIFHIPWIACLSAGLAVGVTPAREIFTERTADGGLLMSATMERLDPDIPEHARRARILAETLITQTGRSS